MFLTSVTPKEDFLSSLREWVHNGEPKQKYPNALEVIFADGERAEIDMHEENYSIEYMGHEDTEYNDMYTFDTLEELAAFVFGEAKHF